MLVMLSCGHHSNINLINTNLFYFLENYQLNFAGGSQCSQPLQCIEEMVCAWEGINMTATEPTTFFVKIGLSGGLRGYQAITGKLKIVTLQYTGNLKT